MTSFHIVLFQPEIPPNTGNVMRLAANAGACLHLVRPLGFRIDDKALARAGMDYRDEVDLRVHDSWDDCLVALPAGRRFAVSTRGATRYDRVAWQPGDAWVFGSETRGLPAPLLESFEPARRLRIPMRAGSRSINLANSVAIVLYEAWRQCGFAGGE